MAPSRILCILNLDNSFEGLFEGSIIAEEYLISRKPQQENSYTVLLPLTGDQTAKNDFCDDRKL